MTEQERRTITRSDIDEIKSDGKATYALLQELMKQYTIHDTSQKALEFTVEKINKSYFGDGTSSNPGYVATTDKRLETVERVQGSYSKAIWAIVTPLLGLIAVGLLYLAVAALAVK